MSGVIHSDFERGAIRVEVIGFNHDMSLGGGSACNAAGKMSVEGKA